MSREMYYTERGKKQDAAIHNEILDNPEAAGKLSKLAIKRAIKSGMSAETAQLFYGTPEGTKQ